MVETDQTVREIWCKPTHPTDSLTLGRRSLIFTHTSSLHSLYSHILRTNKQQRSTCAYLSDETTEDAKKMMSVAQLQ